MNAAVGNTAVGFTAAQIQEARAMAANSQRRFADVLEERSALGPEEYTQAVAKTLGYPVLTMAELHALEPAFDILPFGVALERGCVLFRAGKDRLLLAIGDAFDRDLHDWADARIAQSFATCLVHRTDLAAYLARHEETLRAMDSLLPDADKASGGDVPVEDLSFKTISEDTSPVVRLVHSTLYDAFKVAASDIHLESGAAGMVISPTL